MTKRQIIDEIILLNRTAKPQFLAQFNCDEVDAYLRHLQLAQTPRLTATQGQYAKYFENVPASKAAEGAPSSASSGQDSRQSDFPIDEPEIRFDLVEVEEPTLFDDELEAGPDASGITVAASEHDRNDQI